MTSYLAHRKNRYGDEGFQAALIFAGYLQATHRGIMNRIDEAAPLSTPSRHWMGERDSIISNTMSREVMSKYVDAR